jgi:hypothetical protein
MDGSATLIINPDLDEIDFLVTATELGISMTIATLLVMKIKEKTDVWDEFQVLLHRYRTLTRDGQGSPEIRNLARDWTITAMAKAPVRHCAIYTRKSSEEGLEQEFNSLSAQREACAAFINSQRHEGWTEISSRYDDGGVSGGTVERPALARLMQDIQTGTGPHRGASTKIDRLTRSLFDFAVLVETARAAWRLLCLGHPAILHHHFDGTTDAQPCCYPSPSSSGK